MRSVRPLRSLWLLVILAALLAAPILAPAPVLAKTEPQIVGVHITPIGAPTWKPVDFHMFAAPIGTAPDYAGYADTTAAILPPPKHVAHPDLGIGPGAPHAPPYTGEMAAGVRANRYREGNVFKAKDFNDGQGIYVVWMNVPAPGTTGSSPDFASGPVIANSLFPLHVSGATYHNGKLFNSGLLAVDVPALDSTLDPPFAVDGHSHFPFFVVDSADFGPAGAKLNGAFTYDMKMVDQAGNGWHIEAKFQITG
jgi:hypothetical protein